MWWKWHLCPWEAERTLDEAHDPVWRIVHKKHLTSRSVEVVSSNMLMIKVSWDHFMADIIFSLINAGHFNDFDITCSRCTVCFLNNPRLMYMHMGVAGLKRVSLLGCFWLNRRPLVRYKQLKFCFDDKNNFSYWGFKRPRRFQAIGEFEKKMKVCVESSE